MKKKRFSVEQIVGVLKQLQEENQRLKRVRDECWNVEVFFTLEDAREKLERWRQDYNRVRPHSALGDQAPARFAENRPESALSFSELAPRTKTAEEKFPLLEALT